MNDHNSSGKQKIETVLVMQGGGSLGAYECGVYKALARHDIKFDIIAGTSIGAINAAVIAGTKNGNPAEDLENFWLTLAEYITPSYFSDNIRPIMSSMFASVYGIPNAFRPRWFSTGLASLIPNNNPYLYDVGPLRETLNEFVDFSLLKKSDRPQLIVTCTDIQKGIPITFDSKRMSMDANSILASAGFPFYGIEWTEKDGRFLWDGCLLSNTPLREVINTSPKNDKIVYIVNLFPREHHELPNNMWEAWHRARDIMHTEKTEHNVRMSKVITRYLGLLKQMHDIIDSADLDEQSRSRFEKLDSEYHKLAEERGAIIQKIVRIERTEESHYLLEDADFSVSTIKNLIKQGEMDAEKILAGNAKNRIKEKTIQGGG